jgi:hypothetical protein
MTKAYFPNQFGVLISRIRILFLVLYSALLHLPSLRFHCVGGCSDRNQDSCDHGIGYQTL